MSAHVSDEAVSSTSTPALTVEADLNILDAVDYLRCGLSLFSSMQIRGIVRRPASGGANFAPSAARGDLHDLRTRLKTIATPTGTANSDEASIAWTAATLGVAEVEIVRLILDGVLERVAGLTNRVGIHALLVRPEEVRAHLEERSYPGLPWAEAAKEIRVSPEALTVLVGSGYLKTERAEIALSGYRAAMIPKKSIDAFKHAFVDWRDLCIASGVSLLESRRHPELRNAKPHIFSKAPKMTFYRRSDAPCLEQKSDTAAAKI